MSDAATVEVGGRPLALTHLDKVLYPATGFTKGQVIQYYRDVAPSMMPHLVGRPLTLKRFPEGADGPSFYERNLPSGAPPWMSRVRVATASGGSVDYAVARDVATVVWLANLEAIEFHVLGWRAAPGADVPGPPDYLVLDLDPGEGAGLAECCQVAGEIVRHLADLDLGCAMKTSGRKGLHLLVPWEGAPSWTVAHETAHRVARDVERMRPELVTTDMSRRQRAGRVLIDWSQTTPTKSTVAAYSLRGGDTPCVSAPVSLEEVVDGARGASTLRFSPEDVLARIAHGTDPWRGMTPDS